MTARVVLIAALVALAPLAAVAGACDPAPARGEPAAPRGARLDPAAATGSLAGASGRRCVVTLPRWCRVVGSSYHTAGGDLGGEYVSVLCRDRASDRGDEVLLVAEKAGARAVPLRRGTPLYPARVDFRRSESATGASLACSE